MRGENEVDNMVALALTSAIAYVVLAPTLLLIAPLVYGENLALEFVLATSAGLSLVVGVLATLSRSLLRRRKKGGSYS